MAMAKEASTFFDLSNENVETPGLKPLELEIEDSPAEKMPSKNPFLRYRHFYQVDYRRQRKKLFILGILIFDVCLFLAARFFLSKPNFYYFGRMIIFLALGAYFHLFAFLLIFFLIERVSNLLIRRTPKFYILQSKTLHTVIAIGLALFLTLQGFISTLQRPTIKNLNLSIQNLPAEFENFTIALVSDIHTGPTVGRSRVEEIVEIVNQLDADVVTIAGDLVDGYVDYIGDRVLPIKNLKSKYGTFIALGNHEYIHENVDHWIKFFGSNLNATVLVNSGTVLKKDGKELCIAGVDDYFAETAQIEGHKMDTEKALSSCPSSVSTTILLVHQPNGVAKVLTTLKKINKKVDLILSGHTHAGQMYIVWPVGYLVNHFFYGLYIYPESGTQIYVSSGVNFWGPPIKMLPSLCEIVKIRLHKAPNSSLA
uniref:Calcineurin-like phosphoesterase domain-containing protein n=1 Tax=Panagrolaimus sp. ES5 TaxID=591445 RepID=A0AC34FAG2_9BILA